MNLPLPELTTEDLQRICTKAQAVLQLTDQVCTSTSLQEHHVHQSELEEADSGLEKLIGYLEKEIGKMKNSLEAVESMKKDIGRHGKRTNRSYWLLRNIQPK